MANKNKKNKKTDPETEKDRYCQKCGKKLVRKISTTKILFDTETGEKTTIVHYKYRCPSSSIFSWGHSGWDESIFPDLA